MVAFAVSCEALQLWAQHPWILKPTDQEGPLYFLTSRFRWQSLSLLCQESFIHPQVLLSPQRSREATSGLDTYMLAGVPFAKSKEARQDIQRGRWRRRGKAALNHSNAAFPTKPYLLYFPPFYLMCKRLLKRNTCPGNAPVQPFLRTGQVHGRKRSHCGRKNQGRGYVKNQGGRERERERLDGEGKNKSCFNKSYVFKSTIRKSWSPTTCTEERTGWAGRDSRRPRGACGLSD